MDQQTENVPAGVQDVPVSTPPGVTRRKFIGGAVIGGAAAVISQLLPPLPRQFAFVGPGKALAHAPGDYCTPPCPGGCSCISPPMQFGCQDMCSGAPYGCYDWVALYQVWDVLDPACCCHEFCTWIVIPLICDAGPCRFGDCEWL